MPKHPPIPGIGDRLRELRLRMGFAVKADWCKRIGVEQSTYLRWERDSSATSRERLRRMVVMLGVSESDALLRWLLDGVNQPPSWLRSATAIPLAEPGSEPELGSGSDDSREEHLDWALLEDLVQKGREADQQRDKAGARRLANALRALVCTR